MTNSFNNLNQNVDTVPSGTLTVLGGGNYPGGTATVNNVQAQMAPDGTFAASGVPFALGTNTLASVFTDPYGRTANTETTITISPKTYAYDLNVDMVNDFCFAYVRDGENRLNAVHDAILFRRKKIECAADCIGGIPAFPSATSRSHAIKQNTSNVCD